MYNKYARTWPESSGSSCRPHGGLITPLGYAGYHPLMY